MCGKHRQVRGRRARDAWHVTCSCSFEGHEYVLKELNACTLQEWLQRVVAVVVQVVTCFLRHIYLGSVCLALAGVCCAALAASRCALQGNTWQFKDFHSKDAVQV